MLRGTAIVAMVVIHNNYFFLNSPTSKFLWEYSQFAVQVFIFCSAYLFFTKQFVFSWRSYIMYIKKRLWRLVFPYYLFLAFYIPFVYITNPQKVNFTYVLKSLFVFGGVDISWLVLLVLLLNAVLPIIAYFRNTNVYVFYFLFLLSTAASVFFLFTKLNLDFRLIMWLPWLSIVYAAYFFVKFLKKKYFVPTVLLFSALFFLVLRIFQLSLHHSTSFIENKYPPNLYFLLYGVMGICVLYIIFAYFPSRLIGVITYLSINSYSIYFVHYIVLSVLIAQFQKSLPNWYITLTILALFTYSALWLAKKMQKLFYASIRQVLLHA